jgi:uncharacterized protein
MTQFRVAATFAKFIFLLTIFVTGACAQSDGLGGAASKATSKLVIETANGDHVFKVELVDTPETRRMGLMYRTELAADAGMLFDFEEPQTVGIWMKNTLIPLDIAFIDENGVIKRITPDATPKSLESMPSGALVLSVLEVNGGTFAALGIKAGDRVRHPLFKNQ